MKKLLLAAGLVSLFGFSPNNYYTFEQEGFDFVEKVYINERCDNLHRIPTYIQSMCHKYQPEFKTFVNTEMSSSEIYSSLKSGLGDKLTEIVQKKHKTSRNVLLVITSPKECGPSFYYLNGHLDLKIDLCRNSKFKMVANKRLDLSSIPYLPVFEHFIAHESNQGFLHLKTRRPTKNLILEGVWERVDIFVVHSGNHTIFMVTASYYKGFKPGDVFKSTYDKYPNELESYTIEIVNQIKISRPDF